MNKQTIKWAVMGVAVGWLALIVTDTKMLLWVTKVDPGQHYVVEDYGDLGVESKEQSALVGHYFTGLSIKTRVYWYSSNNMFGRDSCSFLLSKDQ